VTSPGEETSAARPALVTAGGLLLAVALLQIAQQVIGVFDPRPVIQAALIVAAGLAALAAERHSGGKPWRTDRLAQGPASHLFVAARPSRSDEVLVYDRVGGELERQLAFRPEVRFPQAARPTAARFRLHVIRDFDGDGRREVIGAWETNMAGTELQRVPVLIARPSGAKAYDVKPLLAVAALGRQGAAALPTLRFARMPVVWVVDFALDPGRPFVPGRTTLVTNVVLPDGDPHGLAQPVLPFRNVRFFDFEADGAVTPRCVRGERRVLPAKPDPRFLLGRPLADEMAAAGLTVGDYVDGRCVEAPS
jgi:hypothetical protein